MLRAPFLRLFGPLFMSRVGSKAGTKRRSYLADWKSDHHLEPVHSTNKSSASQIHTESERNSEYDFIGEEILPTQSPGAMHRRGSDISIRKDTGIERSESQKAETDAKHASQHDVPAVTRVDEDETDESSAFHHV